MKKFAIINDETNKVVNIVEANAQSDVVLEEGTTPIELAVVPKPGYTYENGVFVSQE